MLLKKYANLLYRLFGIFSNFFDTDKQTHKYNIIIHSVISQLFPNEIVTARYGRVRLLDDCFVKICGSMGDIQVGIRTLVSDK